jgi:hypothetical protein
MNTVVESLRRLYVKESLTEEQIEAVKASADRLLAAKKISVEEYNYIINK